MPFSARVISKVCEVLSAREQLGLEVAINYVFLGLVENYIATSCMSKGPPPYLMVVLQHFLSLL